MERYSSYKDSGISWIGEIPEHWEVKRIASLFTGKVQANTDFRYHHAFKFYYGTLVPKNEVGDVEEYRDTYVKYSVLQKDDIMINGLNLNYDFVSQRVAIAPSDGIITSAYVVARPRKGTNALYYNYLFKTMDNMKLFHGMGTGIRLTLSFDEMKKQVVVVPPQDEQQAIVAYIEEKCQKIDAYVADKEKEIELLQELKQKTIADAVTKGLNPDAKMKDSGISWIGEIPKHWEVCRMKRVFSEAKEKTTTENGTLLSLSQYTGITLKDDAKKVGMFEAESTIGYNVVHPGQFVMNIMLAWNGSYAVSDYEGIISPSYCVFNFNEDCEKKYFHYLLRLPAYAGAFKTMSKGIIESRLRLYPIYFLAFKTIIPPLNEQQAIVAYIEKKCQKIDKLASELQSEIDYLKEYKQRLIADCVTGQVNVQNEMI